MHFISVGGYFQSDRVRVYTSTDVIGVEVGGALKNIYAIAAGSAQGLGFGLNTAAFLVTRGCSEMKKLALARGAKESTLAGLSGIGDLMLTCFGPASRNRTVGVRLGKGEKLDDILSSMGEVAEGVPTAAAAIKMAKQYNVEVPIASAVADILAGRAQLMERVASLLSLPLRYVVPVSLRSILPRAVQSPLLISFLCALCVVLTDSPEDA